MVARFTIDAVPPYTQTINFSNGLPVGLDTTVSFPSWDASPGNFSARCSTYLATEQIKVNDTLSKPFQVGEVDVAVTAITYPTGSIDSAVVIVPVATVGNYGDLAATFNVSSTSIPPAVMSIPTM